MFTVQIAQSLTYHDQPCFDSTATTFTYAMMPDFARLSIVAFVVPLFTPTRI
jgi:hypothetical protein